jgi:glyoxylase-like metal-dependent hydrolase (beta-lactamase superfamily II)
MVDITRRSLTIAAGASAILAAAPRRGTAKPPSQRAIAPSVARRKVGAVTVTALSDGFIDVPYGVFTGAPAAEIEAAFSARFARRPSGTHRIGFTVWLIEDGDKLVLVDSGYAGVAGATTGRLPAALAAVGVRPEDIDAVAITHMHADHVSGLVMQGRPAFPNAEVFINRADIAHFTDPARAAAAPEALKGHFQAAARVVATIPSARLQSFDGTRTITPSISTIDLTGHTPGHTGYRIANGGESLLLVADALFDPSLHPGRTDLGIVFESDPAAATAMRARLFPQAAEERALLAATHMPFPGMGRIGRDGGKLTWVPGARQLT